MVDYCGRKKVCKKTFKFSHLNVDMVLEGKAKGYLYICGFVYVIK